MSLYPNNTICFQAKTYYSMLCFRYWNHFHLFSVFHYNPHTLFFLFIFEIAWHQDFGLYVTLSQTFFLHSPLWTGLSVFTLWQCLKQLQWGFTFIILSSSRKNHISYKAILLIRYSYNLTFNLYISFYIQSFAPLAWSICILSHKYNW